MRTTCSSLLVLALAGNGGSAARAQGVIISEVLTVNRGGITDLDGELSDWLELYNADSGPVNLDGWFLTDDPKDLTQWRFPAVEIAAGRFLVVFASGKDLHDPARELHASFRLEQDGEYLALVKSDGRTIAAELKPGYPPQVPGASYGLRMTSRATNLVPSGATVHYRVPADGSLGSTWKEPEFDDASWPSGPMGAGFDQKTPPTLTGHIQTDLTSALYNVNATVYLRVPFTVTDPSGIGYLRLRLRYDDGFVAYLNGQEVARRYAPTTTLLWNSRGSRNRADVEVLAVEEISIPAAALKSGKNVIAVQALNATQANTDFLFSMEAESIAVLGIEPGAFLYFDVPSPGFANTGGYPGAAAQPRFSQDGSVLEAPLSLVLTKDGADGEIRYTADNSEPAALSALYTEPIQVDRTMIVKARTFRPGLLPSRVSRQVYIFLNANALSFTANLPIFLITTFGRTPNASAYTQGYVHVINVGPDGRLKITDAPEHAGFCGLKIRGASTEGQPKSNYAFEFWDENQEDVDVEPLGLPPESDWVLHAPYGFDPALMRNPFIYRLSNQIGRYASRDRFVEVIVSRGTSVNLPNTTASDYVGVYSLLEKIKRGQDRVDIEPLARDHSAEPEVTGGYMMKIDRLDPGDRGFPAGGQTMGFVYPKEQEVAPGQLAWIKGFIDQFVRDLNAVHFADPERGYAKYIDVDSWIDHSLLNVLTMNVDALRLSAYFFKDRSRKMEFGPIWDFDRSMDSTDGRDDNPRTWKGTGDATDFFNYPWWQRLFKDPAFYRRYSLRWLELRGGAFSDANQSAVIEAMASEIEEAQARNFRRWPAGFRGGSWRGEVNLMKNWLLSRSAWIDTQLVPSPELNHVGGEVPAGFQLTMSSPLGEVLYTLNGPDPRAANGAVVPEAVPYAGPIPIEQNTRVRARTKLGASWSSLIEVTLATNLPALVITEVMYNPAIDQGDTYSSTDYEYVEIYNAGSESIELAGIHLEPRPRFDFAGGSITTLNAGEYALVVKNAAAITSRYGEEAAGRIAGLFVGTGSFSNTSQELRLLGPVDEVIMAFSYVDTWYPETDAGGYSLVLRDPRGAKDLWNKAEAWRASGQVRGSPGREDGGPPPEGLQRPNDFNQDARINISDAIGIVRHLVQGEAAPCATTEASTKLLDADGNQTLNITDAIHLLNYLFLGGPPVVLGSDCTVIEGCPTACQEAG